MVFEWLFTYVCKPPKEAPWDVLGWTPLVAYPDQPSWKASQLQELNNGRCSARDRCHGCCLRFEASPASLHSPL